MNKYFEFNRISYDYIVKFYAIIYGLSVAFVILYDIKRTDHVIDNTNPAPSKDYLVIALCLFLVFTTYYFTMLYKSEICKKSDVVTNGLTPLSRRTEILFLKLGGPQYLHRFYPLSSLGFRIQTCFLMAILHR